MRLADQIAMSLIEFVQRTAYEIVIPNFFVGRYEMDLFRLTKTGYICEYEIKISRSDYFNDFKKSHTEYQRFQEGDLFVPRRERLKMEVNKHEQIAKGKGRQNRFFFVVPKGLIEIDEVPKHAGLIEFDKGHFSIVKNAPLLHKNKSDDTSFYKDLAKSLSFRELSHRNKTILLQDRVDVLIEKLQNQQQ